MLLGRPSAFLMDGGMPLLRAATSIMAFSSFTAGGKGTWSAIRRWAVKPGSGLLGCGFVQSRPVKLAMSSRMGSAKAASNAGHRDNIGGVGNIWDIVEVNISSIRVLCCFGEVAMAEEQ